MANKNIIFLVIVFFEFFISCSNSDNALNNQEKIKEVKISFTYEQVIDIMGSPNESYLIPLRGKDFSLVYEAPYLYSGDFEILFNEDSIVRSIYYGD